MTVLKGGDTQSLREDIMINVSTNRVARLRRKATNRMRPVAVGRVRGKNVFKLKNMGSGLERE